MIQLLNNTLLAAAPIVLVALGGVFSHRAGVTHLGLEGLMLIGAFASVAITIKSGSVSLGVLVAIAACVAVSAVFWLLLVKLQANFFIAGLGLSAVGVGVTSYLLESIFHTQGAISTTSGLPTLPNHSLDGLSGTVSGLSVLAVATVPLAGLSWFVLRRTRFGLRLAAAGEYPFAARSAGVDVPRMRLTALLITGAFCALGGIELALSGIQSFSENMTQGRGYLAFAAVLFGREHPLAVAGAGVFFGFAEAIGIQSQLTANGVVPVQFVQMLPYAVTIVALSAAAAGRRRRSTEPAGSFAELRD